MNKDFFLRIWNIVRYFSSNESKFIYECIDKPTKKPSTCSVIATCKTETTIYHFSDKIHHVLKQQIQFQQLFQGREWWDNLNAPKNFHVTKDFLKMLNFFTHKSGFCWYRKFDNCVYLEECILCKTVKAYFFFTTQYNLRRFISADEVRGGCPLFLTPDTSWLWFRRLWY